MVLGLAGAFSAVGCSGVADTQVVDSDVIEADEAADSLSETSTYFIFTRNDYRKCMWPACGGEYVKRVNRASTKCADGKSAKECYVIDVDLSAIGLSEADAAKISTGFESGLVLLRGKIANRAVGTQTATYLVASEAWVGNAAKTPSGLFYNVNDNGVRCFAAPCKSVHEARLNSSLDREVAGVDFAASGANSKQVDAANAALATKDGVIVAGTHYTVSGAGGSAWALKATEFYTRVLPAKVPTSCPDETVKGVSYVSHDPSMCARIRYFCESGSGFSGECGCGCLPKGTVQCGDKLCASGETCNVLESFPVQYKCSAASKAN
jgi:hypothetical protein